MDAGALNRRVAILRPVTIANAHNEPVDSEPLRVETFAAFRAQPGSERFASAEQAASAPAQFRFHWRADLVRVTDRIEFDGRIYDVLSVNELGVRDTLEVLAVARGEAG